MAKVDELAQLKDIHLPPSVGWWPLAPGWYLLMLLVFVVVIVLSYKIYRKKQHAKPKLQALALLKRYQQHYNKENNSQITSAHISELLRRVALVYFPREHVASLHGDSWLNFLNRTGKDVDFLSVRTMLLELPFKAQEPINLDPLFKQAAIWIGQRGIPCSN